jgi:outer membrane lipoprotein SlyB
MNSRNLSIAAVAAVVALLAGCATSGSYNQPSSTRGAPAASRSAPPPSAQQPRVYSYPLNGQSAQQQDRDRFECFNWASAQTGFDPSRQPLPPETREVIVPAPASASVGATMMAGAVTGALIGAAVGRGDGALVGAVAGTALGAAAGSAEASNARSTVVTQRNSAAVSRYEQQASGFTRAMSACLEGRGYAVK